MFVLVVPVLMVDFVSLVFSVAMGCWVSQQQWVVGFCLGRSQRFGFFCWSFCGGLLITWLSLWL